jgi:hypothetical protein
MITIEKDLNMTIEEYLTKYAYTVKTVNNGVYLFTLVNNKVVTVKKQPHSLTNCNGITTYYNYCVTDNNNIDESVNFSFKFLRKFKIA